LADAERDKMNEQHEQGPNAQGTEGVVGREPAHPETARDVTVTVDGTTHTVHRGSYIVSEFKKLVGVDAARELDEVVHGQFKLLDDNARIVIKGGEVFVSHVRTGAAS
jgi:hypothetical protein